MTGFGPGAYPGQVSTERKRRSHIKLTSHPGGVAHLPIVWGEADPKIRGPVIGSTSNAEHRNVMVAMDREILMSTGGNRGSADRP